MGRDNNSWLRIEKKNHANSLPEHSYSKTNSNNSVEKSSHCMEGFVQRTKLRSPKATTFPNHSFLLLKWN